MLFDQSHHMVNLFLSGPGAIKLISDSGINSVANFPVNSAKHSLMKMSYSQGRIRLFASSCGILRPMLASERGENGMSHERTERTRATETKRVPVETALGRKPIGRPPARVNPAPETHATSNRSQSHDQSKS